MASEKNRCPLCEKKLGLLDQATLVFFGTRQNLCGDCVRRYQRSEGQERVTLEQRLLHSPYLEDRETARREYAEEPARRRAEEEKLRERAARQKEILRCCGRDMAPLGTSTFQTIVEFGAGGKKMTIYRCDCRGQLKFFDPEFI